MSREDNKAVLKNDNIPALFSVTNDHEFLFGCPGPKVPRKWTSMQIPLLFLHPAFSTSRWLPHGNPETGHCTYCCASMQLFQLQKLYLLLG